MRTLVFLLAAATLHAADANTILQRFIQSEKQNDKLAGQYTCREEITWFSFGRNGQPHPNRSETHDVIFVEGVKFRKLVARNGKPLSRREAAGVEQEMRETAAQRRQHPIPGGGSIVFGRAHADVGSYEELLALFDNRLVGEEPVNGRQAWLIESTPPADRAPSTPHERDIFSFRRKMWIDQADNVLARMIVTVAPGGLYSDGGALLASPGSSLTIQSAKIDATVWEPVLIVLEVQRMAGNSVRPWGRTEYRQSQFQKFDVQSTITVEPPK
jgi:hypothetical protein